MKQITSSEELGALIHSMRKSQKITQEKLAAYSGVGIRFIKELADLRNSKGAERAANAGIDRQYRIQSGRTVTERFALFLSRL